MTRAGRRRVAQQCARRVGIAVGEVEQIVGDQVGVQVSCRGDEPLEPFGMDDVVCVDDRHPFASRDVQRPVACGAGSAIVSGREEPDPSVGASALLHDGDRSI
jgi:hypothetical protein